ncbi:MAG: hypothetical protein HYV15_06520 [Elusimicrobia bacterium]|nr:hypothetical protein [Elusimicrobiota bacterium]
MGTESVVRDGTFREVSEVQPDSKKRIVLKRVRNPGKAYRVYQNEAGQILLDPLVSIPAAEAWLYKNRGALSAVRQGLKEAAEGKLSKPKSFAKYADDELD